MKAPSADTDPTTPERIFLPDRSFVPLAFAAGLTVALIGLLAGWVVLVIGVVAMLSALFRWVGAVASERRFVARHIR